MLDCVFRRLTAAGTAQDLHLFPSRGSYVDRSLKIATKIQKIQDFCLFASLLYPTKEFVRNFFMLLSIVVLLAILSTRRYEPSLQKKNDPSERMGRSTSNVLFVEFSRMISLEYNVRTCHITGHPD